MISASLVLCYSILYSLQMFDLNTIQTNTTQQTHISFCRCCIWLMLFCMRSWLLANIIQIHSIFCGTAPVCLYSLGRYLLCLCTRRHVFRVQEEDTLCWRWSTFSMHHQNSKLCKSIMFEYVGPPCIITKVCLV